KRRDDDRDRRQQVDPAGFGRSMPGMRHDLWCTSAVNSYGRCKMRPPSKTSDSPVSRHTQRPRNADRSAGELSMKRIVLVLAAAHMIAAAAATAQTTQPSADAPPPQLPWPRAIAAFAK